MFIGSVAAGYRAADLMSLVSSAHRNDLDIFVYVRDVLDRLLAGETNYDVLRPDVWKQAHPEAIQIYGGGVRSLVSARRCSRFGEEVRRIRHVARIHAGQSLHIRSPKRLTGRAVEVLQNELCIVVRAQQIVS